MKDTYKTYPGKIFEYEYPLTWDNRYPDYLARVDDRQNNDTGYQFPPKCKEGMKVNGKQSF